MNFYQTNEIEFIKDCEVEILYINGIGEVYDSRSQKFSTGDKLGVEITSVNDIKQTVHLRIVNDTGFILDLDINSFKIGES